MSALAQMERELIVERTQAGLAAARSRGRIGGRPCSLSSAQQEQAKKLLESEIVENSLHCCTAFHWPASTNIVQLIKKLKQVKMAVMKNNSVI